MLNITRDYITVGTKRRSGIKLLGVKFLVAHDTGNPNSTAKGNVNYFKTSAGEMSASAHTFIDDKDIIECIPLDEKAWHVWYSAIEDNKKYDSDSNDYAIGVELCYFPGDVEKTKKAYVNYVDYMAMLCDKFKLDPLIYISGHFQLDPTRKTDPMNAFKIIGKTFTAFLNDVKAAMKTSIATTTKISLVPIQFGQTGKMVDEIQSILKWNKYVVSGLTPGLYDDAMAQAVLLFQMINKVAPEAEIAQLRGAVIGPKTIAALSKLQ